MEVCRSPVAVVVGRGGCMSGRGDSSSQDKIKIKDMNHVLLQLSGTNCHLLIMVMQLSGTIYH